MFDGDFNFDGQLDCQDVDLLTEAVAGGSNPSDYDLNADEQVNLEDRDQWLAVAGAVNLDSGSPYLPADANLDGFVDGQDFIVWNNHKFSATPKFCSGDFNMDGFVEGQDFVVWKHAKFQSADSAASIQSAAVPEPTWSILVLLIGIVLHLKSFAASN